MDNQGNRQIFLKEQAHALAAARHGDNEAFKSLTEPYRHELLTHCYRMLGSLEDAEDQLQETFLKAWKRLETYEGRASFRAWLYKIATNACLDVLARHSRRILPLEPATPGNSFTTTPIDESIWIQPFPDERLAPTGPNPEAQYDAYESISLAFLVVLQVLPPRQRAVLILGDVLGWSTSEIADTLGTSLSSVTSLLHRARATMKQRNFTGRRDTLRTGFQDKQSRRLLDRYLRAWETADIEAIISLLTDDAAFPMPPLPFLLQGKQAIRAFIGEQLLSAAAQEGWELILIRANGQPGFAFYRFDEATRTYRPFALQVLTIENGRISKAVTFGLPALFRYFDLPPLIMP